MTSARRPAPTNRTYHSRPATRPGTPHRRGEPSCTTSQPPCTPSASTSETEASTATRQGR